VYEEAGAGEALRFKFFIRFFLTIPAAYGTRQISRWTLCWTFCWTLIHRRTWTVCGSNSFRPYRNSWSIGGNACISKTALPPNMLAPTTSRERTRSQSISLLAASFEFGISVHPLFSYDDGVID